MIQEISAASHEQNIGAEQINLAIQQLDQLIQQNALTSEQVASTAEELTDQAEQLRKTIAFFKTDERLSERSPAPEDIQRDVEIRPPHATIPPVMLRKHIPIPNDNGNGDKHNKAAAYMTDVDHILWKISEDDRGDVFERY